MTVSARWKPFDLVQFPRGVSLTCPISSSWSIPDRPICSDLIVRVTVAATVVFLRLGRSGRVDSVDVSCVCLCEELTCPQAHATGRFRRRSTPVARVLQSYSSGIGRPCVAVRLGPASPHQLTCPVGSGWSILDLCGCFTLLFFRSV